MCIGLLACESESASEFACHFRLRERAKVCCCQATPYKAVINILERGHRSRVPNKACLDDIIISATRNGDSQGILRKEWVDETGSIPLSLRRPDFKESGLRNPLRKEWLMKRTLRSSQ